MKTLNITDKSKIWFSISAIIIVIGIVFMFINGGLNYGIDFTGGSTITATYSGDIETIRELMKPYDETATITHIGNNQESVLIKTKADIDEATRIKILTDFADKLQITAEDIQFETIGAVIGDELQTQAVISLFLAFIGILIYITFRFEVKYGIAAIIALIHDVFIMLAAYSILRIQVNSSFIAAILTIVGYSINNTIVIFDRIRENHKFSRKMKNDELVNMSITQTMTRSINTTLTTLLTIVVLYVLGVPAVKEFALPLIIGILAGAYSSVFLAGPIWLLVSEKMKKHAK